MTKWTFFSDILEIKRNDLISSLCDVSIIKHFKKGEYIFREEEHPEYLYFLTEGIARGFFSSDNGNEITDCFPSENGEPLMGSFALGEATVINVVAETDVSVVGIYMPTLISMLDKYVELITIYNKILSKALYRHVTIKLAIYKHDTMGRYLWFLKAYPDVMENVKHKYIASFLNMTPENLSRVRKKIKEQEER